MITMVKNKNIFKVSQDWGESPFLGEFNTSDKFWDLFVSSFVADMEKDKMPGLIFGKFNDLDGPRTISNLEETCDYKYFAIDVDNEINGVKVDNPITIEMFVEKYNDYTFWLYTSSGYKNDHHKFRVIFKGDSNFERRKEVFIKEFPFADACSGQLNRIFYTPNDFYKNYKYIINEGKEYSFSPLSKIPERNLQLPKKQMIINPNKEIDIHKFPAVKEFMNDNSTSGQNDLLFSALCSAYAVGEPDYFQLQKIISHAKSCGWNEKEIRQKIDSVLKMK